MSYLFKNGKKTLLIRQFTDDIAVKSLREGELMWVSFSGEGEEQALFSGGRRSVRNKTPSGWI